jgi:hypothetical protein
MKTPKRQDRKRTPVDSLVERIAAEKADAVYRGYLNAPLERISRGFDAVLERMAEMLLLGSRVEPGELNALERRVDRLWDRLRRERHRLGLATPEP